MKMNLSKSKKTANKGITLIALVITIIVLLILAGVAIATLTGDNGILTQAQNAKRESEIAEVKEQAKLDIMAWRAERLANGHDATLDEATVKEILNGKTYVKEEVDGTSFKTKSGYTITYAELYTSIPGTEEPEGQEQAVVGEIVTGDNKPYTNNGTAVIPVGFAIVPGLDDVSEGLVISDDPDDTEEDPDEIVANGNQFVWVPVSQTNFATEFVRHDFGKQNIPDADFVSGEPTSQKYAELVGDGINVDEEATSSVQEVQKMYKSVKYNGGFYIGRYEAGVEPITGSASSSQSGSGTVVSKKGAYVYNNIGWSNSDTMTVETGGAVEVARGFAGEHGYDSVTSTLVYGVQWDAVMRWINKDDTLKGYLTNSSLVGNYYDSDSTNNPAKTGAVKGYQIKNIYDMAGNVYEWTMESYDTNRRIYRGGSYSNVGAGIPVSDRGSGYSPSSSNVRLGFRVALYVDV